MFACKGAFEKVGANIVGVVLNRVPDPIKPNTITITTGMIRQNRRKKGQIQVMDHEGCNGFCRCTLAYFTGFDDGAHDSALCRYVEDGMRDGIKYVF